MSDPTLQEVKELIVDLSKQVNELDKKVGTGLTRLDGEIKRIEEKIEQSKIELTGEIKQVETKLTGEIKRVEEKLEAKIDGIDKRLGNEETISRTAFAALVVATLTGLVKYLFFPNT